MAASVTIFKINMCVPALAVGLVLIVPSTSTTVRPTLAIMAVLVLTLCQSLSADVKQDIQVWTCFIY